MLRQEGKRATGGTSQAGEKHALLSESIFDLHCGNSQPQPLVPADAMYGLLLSPYMESDPEGLTSNYNTSNVRYIIKYVIVSQSIDNCLQI